MVAGSCFSVTLYAHCLVCLYLNTAVRDGNMPWKWSLVWTLVRHRFKNIRPALDLNVSGPFLMNLAVIYWNVRWCAPAGSNRKIGGSRLSTAGRHVLPRKSVNIIRWTSFNDALCEWFPKCLSSRNTFKSPGILLHAAKIWRHIRELRRQSDGRFLRAVSMCKPPQEGVLGSCGIKWRIIL